MCLCIVPSLRNFTSEVFLALIAGASSALTFRFFLILILISLICSILNKFFTYEYVASRMKLI